MRKVAIFLCLGLGLASLALLLYGTGAEQTPGAPESGPRGRIISLAPSITETLFALGLGDRVAGVTRFCDYPPEAGELPQVGGLLDPNYEAMAVLEPGLVILLPEHEHVLARLDELGMEYMVVRNRNVEQITATIEDIGARCNVRERAAGLAASIRRRVDRIGALTDTLRRPSVLVSVGRSLGAGEVEEVYAAGRGTLYDELILLAGGRNAYERGTPRYPVLSPEGLMHIQPEIIIDLVPDMREHGLTESAVLEQWKGLDGLEAVRENRVSVLSGGHTVIPGPRIVLVLEELAGVIHPEIKGMLD